MVKFKITGCRIEDLNQSCSKAHDPLIIDVRGKRDEVLKEYFARDYVFVGELSNKSSNIVIYRAESSGRMRLLKQINRAKKFDREVVILYKDKRHYDKLRSDVNDWIEKYSSIQGKRKEQHS